MNNVNRLIASHANLWNQVNISIAQAVNKELPRYSTALDWITAKLKAMGAAAGEASKADFWKEIEMLKSLEAKGLAQPGSAAAKESEYNQRFMLPQYGLKQSEELKKLGGFMTPSWKSELWKQREGQWADLTDLEKKAMLDATAKMQKDTADAVKKAQEASQRLWADYKPRLFESQESEAVLADQKRYEEWRRFWSDYGQRPVQESESVLADQKVFEKWKKTTEDQSTYMIELSQRTADAMEKNFSDLFFDIWTGELDSAADYFKAFTDSIGRMFSDLLGQMVKDLLMGKGAGGQGLGGLLGWIFGGGSGSSTSDYQPGPFAKGGVFGPQGMERFARGGVVDRPWVFPFAGGIGLMGEAGPEAIVPLRRMSSGNLGVETSGDSGAGVNVTINNFTGQPVRQKENVSIGGRRDITIDVGSDIEAGGPLARAIERRYPQLRPPGRIR
jgi:lambda family phage tail tape measure protein